MIYRITYIKDEGGQKRKLAHRVKDREELIRLRNSPEQLEKLARVRAGDEKAKPDLLQLAYNLGHVEGELAGCTSLGSYFFHDVDCYDPTQSESLKNQILAKKDEIGLMMLERSASGGWHLVCRRMPGTTILENMVRVAMVLRIEMDTNVKDLQRVVFSTSGSAEDLVYLDDALFDEPMSPEACEEAYRVAKERERKGLEAVPAGAKKANKHYKPWEDQTAGQARGLSPSCTEVCEATERTRYIFRECMKEEGVTMADMNEQGGRHNSVKMVLGVAIQLLSEGETLGVLKEVMPNNWNDQNIRQLVSDFYTDYYNPHQKLSVAQKRIFRESRKIVAAQTADEPEEPELPAENLSPLSRLFAGKNPPPLPDTLPKLVKLVTQNTPDIYKPTVAQGMFPPLATYPKELSFVYIDNLTRELRINCLIVAETGSGKDTCMSQPLTHITADMKERDEMNRERLRKYNEEFNSKAGNKQKPQRPAGLVIQTIKWDITRAALIQRMDEAQKAPLYVKLNELEQWDKIEGVSGRSNQFTTLKMCDDESNEFGSDRAGTQSVVASGRLHLNWNANTTLGKAVKYFRNVLTDGPISRLCLATVPEREIGSDIEVFGTYDSAYDEALKPYIENLKAATGVIDCQQARRLARKLKQECAEFARLSQDRVFDNLSHRALVHAFRKACLLYVANGMKWEKAIESFCRWSLFYDLFLKMTFWGDQIRHADDDVPTSKRGPRNLLEYIPTDENGVFTYQDAVKARLKNGMKEEGTQAMLSVWKSRKYVLQITDFSYKKTYNKTG